MGTSSRSPCAPLHLAVVCLVALLGASCSRGEPATLDADGVQRAILTETDFPERDGWTSTGISSESATAPVSPTALTGATGMPEPCRRAFAAWTDADRQRKAGVNNNFTKFDVDDLHNAVMVQLAVRSFEQAPAARERLREVARACTGTMTLTAAPTAQPSGTAATPATPAPANKVTIEPNPVSTSDADGLRIVMALDGQPTMLVTVVAQRGRNLAQVVGLGRADRDIPGLVQRVLDAQVKKLEETVG